MRFISVRELRASTAGVWRDLDQDGEVVVMSGSQPRALMVPITGRTLEPTVQAIRRARAVEALDAMNARAAALGNDAMTMGEIDAEIDAARQTRVGAR